MSEGRVAIVDDNRHIVEMLRMLCQQVDVDVVWTAEDGAEALGRLNGPVRHDLLILDLMLPDMDGRQLVKVARERNPGGNILILSGFLPAEGDGRWGADGVLQKGSSLAELKASIVELSRTDRR